MALNNVNKVLSNEEILQRIKAGDERALSPIYEANRRPFLKWAMWHYKCDEYDAADVYQKAFSIFYFNVKDGKLQTLSSKIETYLFAVGKRVFQELYRDKHRQSVKLDEVPEVSQLDLSYFDKEKQTQQQLVVETLLSKLGEACSTVLKMFYYHHFTMQSIAEDMGYKNDLVAKKKKYECLQKLKSIAAEGNYSADDLLN